MTIEFDWDDQWQDRTSDEGRKPRGTFTAKFDSDCPECFDEIEEGDDAVMREGQAICMECAVAGWGGRWVMGLRMIGPLAYQGKEGCESLTCTRLSQLHERCFGWHCSYCDEPCSSQGHGCDAAEAILGESRRMIEEGNVE